jgi:hypothetical protein
MNPHVHDWNSDGIRNVDAYEPSSYFKEIIDKAEKEVEKLNESLFNIK